MAKPTVSVGYYSDLLCVWAYVAQVRLDELRQTFADQVSIEHRFVPVFSANATKIGEGWAKRGGWAGYARHVQEVAARFDHVEVHRDAWTRDVPAGSLSSHAFIKAAGLLAAEGAIEAERVTELAWSLRCAFFVDARNIARLDVQLDVASSMELPVSDLRARLEDGSALAALAEDHDTAERHGISGSPTFLLNEGRQKLYAMSVTASSRPTCASC